MIEFGVLGPLTVYRDGRQVVLSAAMQRGLLTLLLHRPGEPLAVASIMDVLWPDQPPVTARKTLQVYVARLRKALGDGQRIRGTAGHYLITVLPDELDVARFRALIDAGREARRRDELGPADDMLTKALSLWRGTPFADLDDRGVVAGKVRPLEEQWLSAHELRAAVRLDLRRHGEVVEDLAGVVATHSYQERLVSYLMLALYRGDRQSEALDLYRRTRRQLVDEFGIEPGHTMSWLHEAVLRNDRALAEVAADDLDWLGRASSRSALGSGGTPTAGTSEVLRIRRG